MKFGKLYKKQMVPEWTEAYMDYDGLKGILREAFCQQQSKKPSMPFGALHRQFSLCGYSWGLELQSSSQPSYGDIEDQVVSVYREQNDGSRHSFKTRLPLNSEGGDARVMFLRKLDEELDKVNTFYKSKVKEVVNEAALLNMQMDALVALRRKVVNPDFVHSTPENHDSTDVVTVIPMQRPIPRGTRTPGTAQKDRVEVHESNDAHNAKKHTEGNKKYQVEESNGEQKLSPPFIYSDWRQEAGINSFEKDSLDILEHVKFDNSSECSISTIKGIFKDPKEDDLKFRKQELRRAEERLRLVFIEFYQKLCLLRHYSLMNLSAFSKIVKKYEKITSEAASSFMERVNNSLGSSNEVPSLLHRVEDTFIKHFSNSNRRVGMKSLRPKAKKEKQSVSFLSGLCFGCTVALLVAVVITFSTKNLIERKEGVSYMENIFPLYSFFAYIVLHMLVYGANIHFWRRYRVNYPFIFGFKQGTELGYWEVFLLSNGLAILATASFLINLHLDMEQKVQNNETLAEWIPLGLVIVVLIIIICPFDVIYRSTRVFFIRSIFHCICAPFYQVTFVDIFLADQLTSQVQAIRCLELYVCYYGLGELENRQKKCNSHGVYNIFYFVVAAIPYWLRFLQCVRRFCEDRDAIHGYNGLRYFLTLVAVLTRTSYELNRGMKWMVIAIISSVIATIMSIYWDIVVDWGLLQRHSKNFLLRDRLLVPRKGVYFTAMVLDVVLRMSWMQLLLDFDLHSWQRIAMATMSPCLEIFRRGVWSFFRLENEHQNNVAKHRAFKTVPLPFNLSQ